MEQLQRLSLVVATAQQLTAAERQLAAVSQLQRLSLVVATAQQLAAAERQLAAVEQLAAAERLAAAVAKARWRLLQPRIAGGETQQRATRARAHEGVDTAASISSRRIGRQGIMVIVWVTWSPSA